MPCWNGCTQETEHHFCKAAGRTVFFSSGTASKVQRQLSRYVRLAKRLSAFCKGESGIESASFNRLSAALWLM